MKDQYMYAPVLVIRRHTGLLLGWHQRSMRLRGDPEAVRKKTKDINVYNALVGWWSTLSLLINPIIIFWNTRNLRKYEREYELFNMSPNAYIQQAQLKQR